MDVGMAYFLGIEMIERLFDLRMGFDVSFCVFGGFRPFNHHVEVFCSKRMVIGKMAIDLVIGHFGHVAGFREFFDNGFVFRKLQ